MDPLGGHARLDDEGAHLLVRHLQRGEPLGVAPQRLVRAVELRVSLGARPPVEPRRAERVRRVEPRPLEGGEVARVEDPLLAREAGPGGRAEPEPEAVGDGGRVTRVLVDGPAAPVAHDEQVRVRRPAERPQPEGAAHASARGRDREAAHPRDRAHASSTWR